MNLATANNELMQLRQLFRLLPGTPDVLETRQRIGVAQRVSDKQAHDAHLVAMMEVRSVMSILTFNERILRRFPESPC